MPDLRWRKLSGAILPGGSVKPGKDVVLGSDAFVDPPDHFTIYRKLSALMTRIREEKGKSPLIEIDRLPAEVVKPSKARSEPWTLRTPGHRLKWRLLFSDDQLHHSPVLHVSRVGTVRPSAGLAATLPHVPVVGPTLEMEMEIVASIDPLIDLSVMTPWGQGGADMREFLFELAADSTETGDDPGATAELLTSYLQPHLQRPDGWEFSLSRPQLNLGEGERAEFVVRLYAPTPGSAAFAIRMTAVDQPGPNESTSDLLIVEVPDNAGNAALLFADDDNGGEPRIQGSVDELRSWGKAASRRLKARWS
jgi:hypothetical protein